MAQSAMISSGRQHVIMLPEQPEWRSPVIKSGIALMLQSRRNLGRRKYLCPAPVNDIALQAKQRLRNRWPARHIPPDKETGRDAL